MYSRIELSWVLFRRGLRLWPFPPSSSSSLDLESVDIVSEDIESEDIESEDIALEGLLLEGFLSNAIVGVG